MIFQGFNINVGMIGLLCLTWTAHSSMYVYVTSTDRKGKREARNVLIGTIAFVIFQTGNILSMLW